MHVVFPHKIYILAEKGIIIIDCLSSSEYVRFTKKTFFFLLDLSMGFPDGSAYEESACHAGAAGDTGSIPGSGRPSGGGNGNPLQYSCLKSPMDRGAWWAAVRGVAKSQT